MEHRLLAYLYCFNVTKDYFECHEYGESLWLDTGRPQILKGLIQAAVSLYHLQNGNVKGGYAMWLRARRYMQPYLPMYEDIDIETLTADIDEVFRLVPPHWYDRVVNSETIGKLTLPTVKIRVSQDVLVELERFTPSVLSADVDQAFDG